MTKRRNNIHLAYLHLYRPIEMVTICDARAQCNLNKGMVKISFPDFLKYTLNTPQLNYI